MSSNAWLIVGAVAVTMIAVVGYAIYEVTQTAADVVKTVEQWLSTLYGDVVSALGKVIDFFESIPAWVAAFAQNLYSELMSTLQTAQQSLEQATKDFQTAASQGEAAITSTGHQVAEVVGQLSQQMTGVYSKMAQIEQTIQSISAEAWGALSGTALTAYSDMVSAGQTVANDSSAAASAIEHAF